MMMILSIVCFIALCQLHIQYIVLLHTVVSYSVQLAYTFFEMVFIQHTLYETVNQSKLSIGVDGQLKIFNWNFIAVHAAHTHTHTYIVGRLFAS